MNSLKFLVLLATSLCTEKTTKKNKKRSESKPSFTNRNIITGGFVFAFLLLLCFIYPPFGLQESSDNNNTTLYQPGEEHGENSIEKTEEARVINFKESELVLGHFYRQDLKNLLANYSYLYQEYEPVEILETLKESYPELFDGLNIYNYDDNGSGFVIETPDNKKFIFIQSIDYVQERIDDYKANRQFLNELKACINVDMLLVYIKSTDVTFTWTIVEIPEASIIETARHDVNEEILKTLLGFYRTRVTYLLEKGLNPGLISRWEEVLFISKGPKGGYFLFNEEPTSGCEYSPEHIFYTMIENMMTLAYNWKMLGSENPVKFKTFGEIKKEDYGIIQDPDTLDIVSAYYDNLKDKKYSLSENLSGANRNELLRAFRDDNDASVPNHRIYYDYILPISQPSLKSISNFKKAYQ